MCLTIPAAQREKKRNEGEKQNRSSEIGSKDRGINWEKIKQRKIEYGDNEI